MINIFHEEALDGPLWSFVLNSPIYKRTDIEHCDFILHEKIITDKRIIKSTLKSLSKKYQYSNRFILVFIIHDTERVYQRYNNIILIRTSLRASRRKERELVQPFIWDSLAEAYP